MHQLRHRHFRLQRAYEYKVKPVLSLVLASLVAVGIIVMAYEIGTGYFCILTTTCSIHCSYLLYTLAFTFLSAFAFTFTY